MKTNILIAVLMSLIFGCSSLKKMIGPPKVKLQDVSINKLSMINADLEILLSVQNPNNIDLDVKNLRYALDINSKTLTSGTLKDKILVRKKETTIVSVPLRILYKDILSSALLLLNRDGMPYRVQGSVEVGPFTIPFDETGTLKSEDLQ